MNYSFHDLVKCVYLTFMLVLGARGGVMVKALRYKAAGRGFDWNFSVT